MTIFTLRERLNIAVRRAYENTLYLADSAVERIVTEVIDELRSNVIRQMMIELPCGCTMDTDPEHTQGDLLVKCPGGGQFLAPLDPAEPDGDKVWERCRGGRTYGLTAHSEVHVNYSAKAVTVPNKES